MINNHHVYLTKFGIVHENRVEYKPSAKMHNFLSHRRTTNVMQQSFMVQTKVDCVSTCTKMAPLFADVTKKICNKEQGWKSGKACAV
jgi:hypothetical protein